MAQVNGNITIINVTVDGEVCGNTGYPNSLCSGSKVPLAGHSTNVTNNQVIIASGADVINTKPQSYGTVYGGYSEGTGYVTGNTVEVNGTTGYAYGGFKESTAGIGGIVSGNTVIVKSGGIVTRQAIGGANHNGHANENKVIIESGGFANSAEGGRTNDVDRNVIGNEVYIMGDVATFVVGAAHYRFNGEVSNNIVVVSGTVGGFIFGGYSTGNGLVKGNDVNRHLKMTQGRH